MDNLCTSCLCAGRKLYFLSETGFEQLYKQILNEIPVYNISEMCIRICWECKALLRKLANFKEQVKTCYMELLQYLQRNTVKQFANFSRLQNHQNEILSFPQVTVKEDIEEYSFVDDDRSYVDDDILCMNNDDPDSKDEETHFEPATFVNDLNMDNLKKRKSGRKRNKLTKQKSKNKLNIIKQKGAKRNVKLKNVTQDELSNHTVESLIDSTAQGCYKRQEGRSEENKREEIATDNIQLGSQANDRSASKQFSTFSHLNNNENLSYPQVSVKEEVQELPFADDGIPYVDDNRPFVDDDICMNNDDLDLKDEETHCEPETFVKDLNMDEIKKRKNGRKGDKLTKQKSKLKINKLKSKKQKVKLKKISSDISQDLCQDELSNKTVESLIDSTLVDCYKKNEKRIGVEEKIEETEDSLQLEKESNDGVERNITRNRKLSNAVSKMMNESVSDKPVCVECGKTFSSRKTYRYHLNVLHKGQNRYPCPRCGKVYQWKSNLGRHMRSHKARDSGELYCETCDKRFASVATFRQHLRISRRHVPESEFSFMCNECGKKFVNKTRLRDHIDWEHLKKIKFKCQLCNKPFKCHTSLYVHMQNVHRSKDKKDNLCHVCGKSYQNAAKLKYHIVAMHTTETPYQCQQCNAAFGWYSSLYRHVREVHYKLKVQPKKSKKQKKSEVLPSLLPVLPPIHHPV